MLQSLYRLSAFLALAVVAEASNQPNIIVLLTDDQDLRLGSMQAMPYTRKHLVEGGEAVNMTNFFVNTPICCPSRTVLLSGRMNHNNKARSFATSGGGVGNDGMCMRMNTSQTKNPGFWQESFVQQLHDKHNYTTGLFGKVLNTMKDYGCNAKTTTSGVDRMFVMCEHVFYNEQWIDQGAPDSPKDLALNKTGSKPDEYTTSLMGNATMRWLRSVLESNKKKEAADKKPFFAWIGPHAPHLPSTPAKWYLDHPVGDQPVVKEPNYGLLGKDKHAFYPREPTISDKDAASIQNENSMRLRSLLSVDDIVREVREYLIEENEWDNTVMIFTSDHGYTLGGFRVDSHKMQVYDHVTRVPFLVHAPGMMGGSGGGSSSGGQGGQPKEIDIPVAMVDVAPTLLAMAGGAPAATAAMDGISFAGYVAAIANNKAATNDDDPNHAPNNGALTWPRDAVLIEYQSIQGGPANKAQLSAAEWRNAYGYHEDLQGVTTVGAGNSVGGGGRHIYDGPNNTYSALRYLRGELGELLYAEFADVSDPLAWDFAPDRLNFFELYNMSSDPFMLDNIYHKVDRNLKKELHRRLQKAISCKGAEDCTGSLN